MSSHGNERSVTIRTDGGIEWNKETPVVRRTAAAKNIENLIFNMFWLPKKKEVSHSFVYQ